MVGANAASETDTDGTERRPSSARIAGYTVIVLDASVVVELLTNGPLAESLRRDLARLDDSFIVPHLLDVEVVSALRNLASGRRIDSHRTEQLLSGLAALPAERYSHTPLLGRIWELRHNFTAYDASYIALAEATDSVLYTSDSKLCKGHRARVVLFTPPSDSKFTRQTPKD
jgi:predicted nucleic acid-binding protein